MYMNSAMNNAMNILGLVSPLYYILSRHYFIHGIIHAHVYGYSHRHAGFFMTSSVFHDTYDSFMTHYFFHATMILS